MKAMLLAAGRGTRFRPYTDKVAKPAISFLNLPLLAFPLYLLEMLGVSEVIINSHHQPDSLQQAVATILPMLKANVHFSHEPVLLDSGGGLKNVKSFFAGEENFLLANADSLMLFPHALGLQNFWQQHRQSSALASLLICNHPGVGSQFGGVWVDKEMGVMDIGKVPPANHSQVFHYTGFLALNHQIFKFMPEQNIFHIFTDLLVPALRKGQQIKTYYEDIAWFETGDIQSYEQASRRCLEQLETQKAISTWQPIDTLRATFDHFKVKPNRVSLG